MSVTRETSRVNEEYKHTFKLVLANIDLCRRINHVAREVVYHDVVDCIDLRITKNVKHIQTLKCRIRMFQDDDGMNNT